VKDGIFIRSSVCFLFPSYGFLGQRGLVIPKAISTPLLLYQSRASFYSNKSLYVVKEVDEDDDGDDSHPSWISLVKLPSSTHVCVYYFYVCNNIFTNGRTVGWNLGLHGTHVARTTYIVERHYG